MPLKQASFEFNFETEVTETASDVREEIIVSTKAEERNLSISPPAEEKKSTRGRMKISEMKASALMVEVPDDDVLFSKSYYSIGTVSEMFNVNPSLLRFWESEFSILKPKKNGKGDRFFRPQDIKNLQLIYHLLRERKYTIDGAREYLKKNARTEEKFALIASLKRLKLFLTELKASL